MDEIQTYWESFLEKKQLPLNTKYLCVDHFDNDKETCNYLLDLAIKGKKCATSSLYFSFLKHNIRIPRVGDYSIFTDWDGKPRCVIETTNVYIKPFKNLTWDLCKLEGEDENFESWKIGHIQYFKEESLAMRETFTENSLIVFEEIKVVSE